MIIIDIWEFFIWPLAVILVSGLIIFLVKLLRPELKLIIDNESLFKMIYNNKFYIVYKSNLIIKDKETKYNIRIETVPNYELLPYLEEPIVNNLNDSVQFIGFN